MNDAWVAKGNAALELNAYGPESYDAVVLLALAALEARSAQGANMSMKLREVSGGEGGGTKCTTFAECADIINGGGTADYDGPSGNVTFNEVGDPTDGNILIQQFDANNVPVTIRG
jgi:branched-chain amino acid transport system substrate-binding protein